MRKAMWLISSFLLGSNVAFRADIAPTPVYSESITPARTTHVRMESEVVTVVLNQDRSRVHATFYMKNLGPRETLQVGFPEFLLGPEGRNDDGKLINLKVTVDGRKVTTARVDWPGHKFRNWPLHWHVWDMTFQKKEARTIVVSYTQPRGPVYSHGLLQQGYFAYLLETGQGWNGTIGKVKVVINLGDVTRKQIHDTAPARPRVENKALVWTWTDLEPTKKHNIRIDYNRYADFHELVRCRQGKIQSWDEAWRLAHVCVDRIEKPEAAEAILTRGLTLAHDTPAFYTDARMNEWRFVALYQQLARARSLTFRKLPTPENRARVEKALDQLRRHLTRLEPSLATVSDADFMQHLGRRFLEESFELWGSWKDFVLWFCEQETRLEKFRKPRPGSLTPGCNPGRL